MYFYTAIICVTILSVLGSEPPLSEAAKEAQRSGGWDGCVHIACVADYDPVCGSDGKTYSNNCLLTVAQCKDPAVTMAHRGECSVQEIARDVFQSHDTNCELIHCSKSYIPVCGSDHKSYYSECVLKKTRCQSNPTLKVEYKGLCKREHLPVHPHTQIPPHIPEDCQTFCTMDYSPVCGTDGRTYSNKCELDSIACVQRSGVTMIKEGPCGQKDSGPVRLKRANDCPNKCPKMYKPVCGSDGKTYNNECLLLSAKCNQGSDTLSVAHKGEC